MVVWLLCPQKTISSKNTLQGASYVNIYYLLLHTNKIPEKDREFCINLTPMAVTAGITGASLFVLAMDNTFLKHK